ncbi:thiamine diphosphokinase [Natranaerovirga hydrolytica]|uniref:Thiamine diphosphokinase n=1 Tax=Natranaerovirga hydrolytica TaxID=680378 RepID=A0A4R1N5Q4_9FIRM|nr:thiamine diphosphokinase [Natranaerovirga hydrolytica]TCK98329.1 thiamine diphosphokinase [Natranaerovirga hydrolytica]
MRALIVTGGTINEKFLKDLIAEHSFDYSIVVDGALDLVDQFNMPFDLLVGDLDTAQPSLVKKYKKKDMEIVSHSPDKDYTDTHLALIEAVNRGCKEVTVVGGLGSRMDHTLANIHVLKYALDNNVRAEIINEQNRIYCMNKALTIEEAFGKYISLIPLSTSVEGISSEGLKYELQDTNLKIGHSIGVSNEIMQLPVTLRVKKGYLIIIQSQD